ncbi:hypothetical protein HRI_001952900 [Hibiscus trionum]|uniref:DUF4283 domain-containing protein n=1 Tax=Hibiscus trionum TaxID=183268 RepID=A0A9W7M098_HIBTR|nr:hypothetical protein HRI_001952900 [Hibiscus trionum]
MFKMRDFRTYKEALMSKKVRLNNQVRRDEDTFSKVLGGLQGGKNKEKNEEVTGKCEVRYVSEYPPVIKKDKIDRTILFRKELAAWIRYSVVGKIKSMYNTDIVQDALRAEGLRATVCPWEGNLVVIRLFNEQERNLLWESRRELLRTWLDELELLEGFDGKHVSKCWVLLSNVPLRIWNPEFFTGLCNQWGEVIKIDNETRELQRFDRARILIRTANTSRIPDRVSVLFHGVIHQLVVKTEEFEEDRVFIDGSRPGEERESDEADALFFDQDIQDVNFGVEKAGDSRFNGSDNFFIDDDGATLPREVTDNIPCGSTRDDIAARAQSTGSDLYEVVIGSEANPPLSLGLGARPGYSQRFDFGPAVSNGSQLHSVEIGLAGVNDGNWVSIPCKFHPGASGPLSGLENLKAGASSSRSKSKVNKNVGDKISKVAVLSKRSVKPPELLVSKPADRSQPLSENSVDNEEARTLVSMGVDLGVEFEASPLVIAALLLEVENGD